MDYRKIASAEGFALNDKVVVDGDTVCRVDNIRLSGDRHIFTVLPLDGSKTLVVTSDDMEKS